MRNFSSFEIEDHRGIMDLFEKGGVLRVKVGQEPEAGVIDSPE